MQPITPMNENKHETISRLAKDVMPLSRNQLLVNLRFLDAALSRLELVETSELIDTVQEESAVNVSVALPEYRIVHFADYTPMEEFMPEW